MSGILLTECAAATRILAASAESDAYLGAAVVPEHKKIVHLDTKLSGSPRMSVLRMQLSVGDE